MTNFEEMLKNLCDNLETQKQAFKQDRWAQIEAGEFMIYTDGNIYKCLSDTVYSPEEYAAHWQIQK